MTTRVVVVGAGGFGRETLDVIAAINASQSRDQLELIGVLDDGPSDRNLQRLTQRGVTFLGSVGQWLDRHDSAQFAVAVGSPSARRFIAAKFEGAGCAPVTLIHPMAAIGTMHQCDLGAIVCGGVQISTNVRVGRHVHINPNATIGHDCELGDYVSVNPAATVSGECLIGDAALIGAGSVILQGLRVGARSTVGAAACVVRDVPVDAMVKGVPAR